jgi:hypothetical protein
MKNTFSRCSFSLALILILGSLSGCAAPPVYLSKQEAFPKMYQEKPRSILVVPAMNDTTAADAGDLYISTIAPPLSWAGYYVLPTEITTPLLRDQGITDGHQLLEVPPQRFKTLFGADAVLFVDLTKWDTSYNVLSGGVTVAANYTLKSTITGETLWHYQAEQTINTSGNSNNGGLIGALIATAIQTATQDYFPVAQQVNTIAISTLPVGARHPAFGKDAQVKNVYAGYTK